MLKYEVNEENLKKNLLRNSPEELVDNLIQHMRLLNAAEPILKWAEVNRVESTRKLPFIPEDLGFKEHIEKPEGLPTIRIYHRDGVSISKKFDGWWSVVSQRTIIVEDEDGEKEEILHFKQDLKIENKFRAIIIFTAIGVEFAADESTVPDTINKPIAEILDEAKGEEE